MNQSLQNNRSPRIGDAIDSIKHENGRENFEAFRPQNNFPVIDSMFKKCPKGHELNTSPIIDPLALKMAFADIKKHFNNFKASECSGCRLTRYKDYKVGFHYCKELTEGSCNYQIICNKCF